MAFEEPDVIATFDRSFGDKKEQLRLERGTYNGKSTFTLGVYWKTPDGQWRWSSQKASSNGKYWNRFSLKARELEELGRALIEAANSRPSAPAVPRADFRASGGPSRVEFTAPDTVDGDDIPF